MKVRTGFVSNSSSSSFICDISGQTFSGWDMCPDEFGLVECVAGHLFLGEYKLNDEVVEKWGDEFVAESACPLCSFNTATDEDIAKYFLKEASLTKEVFARNVLANKFKTYDKFMEYIDENS